MQKATLLSGQALYAKGGNIFQKKRGDSEQSHAQKK